MGAQILSGLCGTGVVTSIDWSIGESVPPRELTRSAPDNWPAHGASEK